MTQEFNDILNFDPLYEAELVTGKSYKDDPATAALGLTYALAHNERLEDELSVRDDTHYSSSFQDTLRVYADLGFEVVYRYNFPAKSHFMDRATISEEFVVLWRDGVLAHIESYGGPEGSTNTNAIQYNWKPNSFHGSFQYTSSGHFYRGIDSSIPNENLVWVGHHDGRIGLRHILAQLEANGTLLPVWVERDFMWLVNYSQTRDENYDYRAINEQVISALPQNVRDAITPVESD